MNLKQSSDPSNHGLVITDNGISLELIEWTEELFPLQKIKDQGDQPASFPRYCFKQKDLYRIHLQGDSNLNNIFPQVGLVISQFRF